MKKVLIYDGDDGVCVWDVSTPELKEKAFKSLFELLDGMFMYYEFEGKQEEWCNDARKGDYTSILALLTDRKGYEHEEWYITEVKE